MSNERGFLRQLGLAIGCFLLLVLWLMGESFAQVNAGSPGVSGGAAGSGGSGTVNANNGTAGAVTNYPVASGSTAVSADQNLIDTGSIWDFLEGIELPNGSATAPSLYWANSSTAGFYSPAASNVCYAVSSNAQFCLETGGTFKVQDAGGIQWTTSGSATGSNGTSLGSIGTIGQVLGPGTIANWPTCKITTAVTLSTSPTAICSWTLPNSAFTWAYQCSGTYSLTSGTTPTLILGVNASQAPTSETANFSIGSTLTGTSTQASGTFTASGFQSVLTGATNTQASAPWRASGTIQASATSGTFAISGEMGGTTPAGTINVGSTCYIY